MKRAAKHRSIWPSILFGLAALGLALISWSLELVDLGDQALDISLHDTYYVLPALWPWYAFIGLLLAFAVVYLVLSRWLDSRLSIAHFVLWVPLPLISMAWLYHLAGNPKRYYSYGSFDLADASLSPDTIISGAAILFLLGAVLFVANMVITMVRAVRSNSTPSI